MNPASASSPWAGRIAGVGDVEQVGVEQRVARREQGAAAEPVADLDGGRRLVSGRGTA